MSMGEKQWTPTQPQLASPEDPDHTQMVPAVWTRYTSVCALHVPLPGI